MFGWIWRWFGGFGAPSAGTSPLPGATVCGTVDFVPLVNGTVGFEDC